MMHTAELDDTAIPHVKIKSTEIPHEKNLIPQYRKSPCPLNEQRPQHVFRHNFEITD